MKPSTCWILGRCTSGRGGNLILDGARAVLQAEFPELAARLHIQLPDEKQPASRAIDRRRQPAGVT